MNLLQKIGRGSFDFLCNFFSDTLVSQQPTPPPSQKGIRKKVRPATSVGPRKKYNIDGRPDQRVKRIYKNLSNQDKKFLNNMYDGLIGKIWVCICLKTTWC